ncbi:MAG: hypothetical protein QOK60_05410 [Nitrososphaeraceae archaeon]|nr:hypothetical protein [Nitrososphaeraceae archaeon]
MKIRVNFGLLILFGIFVISSIMLNPVLAQIPTMTGVGVKIDTPSDSVSVPVGDLTINGASSDNNTTNCQVYADWNDLKPMQIVTANGPKGDADYSKWSYTYNGDYHGIVEGSNELTSKITCYDQVQKATSSKSYSINVTGTKAGSEIVNNTGNPNTVSEDTNILPVKSSSSNDESSNDTVEKSNESTDTDSNSEDTKILPVKSSSSNDESSNDTVEKSNESTDTDSDSEDTNVIPVKNILPLYSESNEESTKSASTEDADETEVASTDTVELQDEPNSNETEVASTDMVELQYEPNSKEIIDSDSETYATVSSKQQGETGESNTIDMSESEAAEASDEGLTSHSESNTFFTFEPDLVADEFSNNDENTVGTSSSTDSSVSNHDSDDNSIFGLKFNGLEDATKNKIEKKIEKLEDRIADRVQLFDPIG